MRIPVLARYVALPASAALLALTGCASSGSGDGAAASAGDNVSPLQLIQAAYTTTTAAKSARIAITFDTDNPSPSNTAGPGINGVEDFEHQRAETTTSLSGVDKVEMRQIGSDIYTKLPASMAEMQLNHDANKPWTHIRIPATLIPSELSDPAGFVKLLTSVTSSVITAGNDEVRGQWSTHYRMTVDESKIRKLGAHLGDCGDDEPPSDTTTPVDVWLDGQGRLTRMRTSIGLAAAAPQMGPTPSNTPSHTPPPTASNGNSMTIELYDFGAPVSIEAPPADQTQTINDAFGDASDSPCSSVSSGSATLVRPS